MKKLLTLVLAVSMMISLLAAVPVCAAYDPHDLSDFGYRTVSTGGRGSLVFQSEPGGSVIPGYEYWTGDSIYVNLYWREKGYTLAYQNGMFGFVDASYIDWGTNTGYGYDPHNLSDYGWRTVTTGGRGNLVFQTEPGGSFMSDHSFSNGSSIYVNLNWREKGYAMAYDNGVYGYVDAGYINWGGSSASAYDPHKLSEYGWRTVTTGGRGNLVFQTAPGGSFMSDHSFSNGSSIYVNLNWRENGYAMAYDNGVYGYVDAGYINWGSTGGSSYDPHDLSYYGYRTVTTGGRGNLIFQTEPGGSFMSGHSFSNGSTIYVNLNWREKGYAMAYDNGVYGYVDAGYISW